MLLTRRESMISSLLGLFGCGKGPVNAPGWTRSRVLAKLDNLRGVAAAGGSVFAGNFDYHSRRGTIVEFPASGGPPRILAPDAGLVDSIRIAGGYLYWTSDGLLSRIKLAGGARETVAQGAVPTLDFVIHRGRVWFSAGIPLGGRYYVYSVPVDGGTPSKLHESTNALSNPMPAGGFVYWMSPGGLARMKPEAEEPRIVHPAEGGITAGLTRDADALYFFQQASPRTRHKIIRYPINGEPPSAIAAPAAQTTHEILADGADLFYVATPNSFGPYELKKVAKTGGASATLDAGYTTGQLASDAEHVYIVTINEVVAVPKV